MFQNKYKYLKFISAVILVCGGCFSLIVPAYEKVEDKVKINETADYVLYMFKSSIKNLPPDWKKVWVLKNFKLQKNGDKNHIMSTRTNIVFDCVGNTYYTLSSINYSEIDAFSKPMLQTTSGFNPREIPIKSNEEYLKVFNQVCK